VFTVTAILALTLGIAANTAIFSVINTVILEPVPFPEPDRLIQLVTTENGRPLTSGASATSYMIFREQTEVIEDVAAYRSLSVNYTGGDTPESVSASQVTEAYFRTFRARLALGRSFMTDEDLPGASQTTVISDGFWTRRLGGAPDVVGTTLWLSGRPYTIVGVTAPEFDTREFRQGMILVLLGIAIGLAVAFFLADLLASILFGVEPRDAIVFLGVPFVLALVSVAAVSIPAYRASRIDPVTALRYE
jgi:ABC-type antimicrobial peptide transport system permease subunit